MDVKVQLFYLYAGKRLQSENLLGFVVANVDCGGGEKSEEVLFHSLKKHT